MIDDDLISNTIQELFDPAGSFMLKNAKVVGKIVEVDLLCEELSNDITNTGGVINSDRPDFIIDLHLKSNRAVNTISFRINGVTLETYIEAVNPNYYPYTDWTYQTLDTWKFKNTDTSSVNTIFKTFYSNYTSDVSQFDYK